MLSAEIRLPHIFASSEILADSDDGDNRSFITTPDYDAILCGSRAFKLFSNKLGVSLEDPDGDEAEFVFTIHGTSKPYEFDALLGIYGGCYDAYSGHCFLIDGQSLVRLREDDSLERVAGMRDAAGRADGKGANVRFEELACVTSDGCGCLYVADGTRVRRVQLPPAWRRDHQADGNKKAGGGNAVTVGFMLDAGSQVVALAYDGTTHSLLYATSRDLFRLPLRRPAAGPGGRGHSSSSAKCGGGSGKLEPQHIAGGGESSSGEAPKDFDDLVSMVVDGDGNIFVLDLWDGERCCIKVIRGGSTATAAGAGAAAVSPSSRPSGARGAADAVADSTSSSDGSGIFECLDDDGVLVEELSVDEEPPPTCMAILRNGSLAVACRKGILALWLGLKPPLLRPPAPPAAPAPPPRSLAADLGALLASQPDATSDLTLRVGGRSFAVHRAILAARCDYFRQRLAADTFADGAAAELELPDADADAFGLLLRWLYTGAVQLPATAGPLQCVAELADRLLLPELREDAARRLLAAVTPETVVDALLWAERQGAAGEVLLAELKEWYLEHGEEVAAAARDSLRRLAVASPDLMVELHVGAAQRHLPAKRPKT